MVRSSLAKGSKSRALGTRKGFCGEFPTAQYGCKPRESGLTHPISSRIRLSARYSCYSCQQRFFKATPPSYDPYASIAGSVRTSGARRADCARRPGAGGAGGAKGPPRGELVPVGSCGVSKSKALMSTWRNRDVDFRRSNTVIMNGVVVQLSMHFLVSGTRERLTSVDQKQAKHHLSLHNLFQATPLLNKTYTSTFLHL